MVVCVIVLCAYKRMPDTAEEGSPSHTPLLADPPSDSVRQGTDSKMCVAGLSTLE